MYQFGTLINILLLGSKLTFAQLTNYELQEMQKCNGIVLVAGINFTLAECADMCTAIYRDECAYFNKWREELTCYMRSTCSSIDDSTTIDCYRKLVFEEGVDVEVGSVALDEGLTCEGGDLMYIYSGSGSWGIVITVEKCLQLCWAHAACVAVIYQLDGYRCELKQSCTVVTGGDVTRRAMLVEQKVDSSLTAITDGDNATCAAVDKNAMTVVTHSDSATTFNEIRFPMWGHNFECMDAAMKNVHVMVEWVTAESTATRRFYWLCSVESATSEGAMDVCVYRCECQGRCNSVYLRAVGERVTLCGVQFYGNYLQ